MKTKANAGRRECLFITNGDDARAMKCDDTSHTT